MLRILIQILNDLARRTAPGCAGIEPQYAPRPIDKPKREQGPLDDSAPLISIVIPSFNQAQFLEQTILSVLDQDYPKTELIVVDGASTDDSRQVIERYSSHLHWWVTEPDSGQAAAINKGMRRTSGEIMAWLNSDDMLMPGALARISRHFLQSPDIDVVYGHRVLVDKSGMEVGRWVLPSHNNFVLSYADYIPQETMYWRRSIWEKSGSYIDESYQFALDWELIMRFLDAGARFHRIPAFLGQFRVHPGQKTNAEIEQVGFGEMEKIRAQYLDRYDGRLPRALLEQLRLLNLAWFMLKAKFTELGWRWRLTTIS